jgi:hypothetical protein
MRLAGSESWRVGVGGGQTAHALLYVRDACQLAPSGPEVPPKLAAGVERIDLGFSAGERAEASEGWTEWWHRYVQEEGLNQQGEWAHMNQLFSPRDFVHLASCPPLQEAARRSCDLALAWWRENRQNSRQTRHDSSRSQSMRAIAEALMDDHQVGGERVRAGVMVLAVDGVWSNIPQPGVLLCSEALFADSHLYGAELRRALESGLTRGA